MNVLLLKNMEGSKEENMSLTDAFAVRPKEGVRKRVQTQRNMAMLLEEPLDVESFVNKIEKI